MPTPKSMPANNRDLAEALGYRVIQSALDTTDLPIPTLYQLLAMDGQPVRNPDMFPSSVLAYYFESRDGAWSNIPDMLRDLNAAYSVALQFARARVLGMILMQQPPFKGDALFHFRFYTYDQNHALMVADGASIFPSRAVCEALWKATQEGLAEGKALF